MTKVPGVAWKMDNIVLAVFDDHPGQEFDAAGIVREMRLKGKYPREATVRAVLSRLFNAGKIARMERGVYKGVVQL